MSVSDYKKNPNINLLPAMTGSIEYGYYWGGAGRVRDILLL